MKNTILTFCCILLQQSLFAENKDWLIDGSPYKTEVNLSSDKKQIELTNGLLRRSFSLTPNGATIALDNLMTGQNELRAVRPEAVLVINGKEYPVGGLEGQPVHNFLTKDFLSGMQLCDSAFVLAGYTVSETKERFPWKPNEAWISNRYPWPAPGKRITFTYRAPRKIVDECKGLTSVSFMNYMMELRSCLNGSRSKTTDKRLLHWIHSNQKFLRWLRLPRKSTMVSPMRCA